MYKFSVWRVALITLVLITGYIAHAQISLGDELTLDYQNPQEYIIGGITVSGIENLDRNVIKMLSGLSVGDKIKIPGEPISNAVKNLWDQGLFEDIAITATKIEGNNIFIDIYLKERPRLSRYSFEGVRKAEADNLRDELNISRGDILTENLIIQSKNAIRNYFIDKGFLNVEVKTSIVQDTARANYSDLYFHIVKNNKVKIRQIMIDGNDHFSDNRIKRYLKETKEKGKFNPVKYLHHLVWDISKDVFTLKFKKIPEDISTYFADNTKSRIFKSSKYIKKSYQEDKNELINKYNKFGYRDASISGDSIVHNGDNTIDIFLNIDEGNRYYFRNINWVGNTIYTDDYLTRVLRIQKGDIYNWEQLNANLTYNMQEDDISSLYMNDGYLFFSAVPVEVKVENDSIDLEIRIYEGNQATIKKVSAIGNTRTMDHVIFREVRTRPGDLFSRSNLIRTTRELAQLGYFNQETINPGVNPNPADGTVDIEYSVEETSSDQIELSGGWGYNRIIGTLGVKFSNFAAKNMFKKGAWRPVPAGGGQQLSLRFQTTGSYYTSYSASFTEPWLGGKKPNALSFSVYNTTFTNGITRKQASEDTSLTRQSFNILGVTVGFGKRLTWPDDFFQFFTSVNIQQYRMKDYTDIFSFGSGNGTYNNFSLQTSLTRNSTDGYIYPRFGSDISASVELTPPYSLFSDKDYANLEPEEKYKWMEYHKWSIRATHYTKIAGDLVFMTRAKFGFLGHYNSVIGTTPFERYFLGGDGLSGFNNFDGREIIGMRGYSNESLTPDYYLGSNTPGGTIYNKYTFELRYPLSLNPSATIFVTSFFEAGNAWKDFDNFTPFDVYRSAGVGVRVFLPMFGMLGLDWGYGFDEVPGLPDAHKGQFHFSINQSID